MKAVVSNRIYLDINNPDDLMRMEKELTYKIDSYRDDRPPTIIKNLRKIKDPVYSIPVGRFDLIPKGYEIVDKRVLVPVDYPEFRFDLRDSQQDVYDQVQDNCVINAKVSWGKTFTAIALAAKLGQKALVVTHRVGIRTHWESEIKKALGITPGVIGSSKFTLDSPIVVGNTQTLYKHRDQLAKKFGTLIVDECHHIPADTFSKLVDSSYARYKIGLSGTIERKDGRHILMPDYFGFTRYSPPAENYLEPTVDIIKTDIRFMDGANTPWALRVNDLIAQDNYGELVSLLAAIYAKKGHTVLVLADRVHFLKRLHETLGDKSALITGQTSLDEREKITNKLLKGEVRILLGTQSIFSEGISINSLSCLILGTPVSNNPLLEQLVGRIVRIFPGKPQPVVVDINLKGRTAQTQAQLRMGHYIKQGYRVNVVKL